MEIKKEQVLALLALAVGALVWKGLDEPAPVRRWTPAKNEYAPKTVAPSQIVTTAATPPVRRDFCTEPSETRPLPPRQLEFPPHATMSLAALPLEHGPDLRFGYALRVAGEPLEGVTVAQSGEAAPAAAPSDDASQGNAPTPGRAEMEARAARTYDRIYYNGLKTPEFGTIENTDVDLFALEERRDFEGVVLRLRIYEVMKQKSGPVRPFGADASSKIDYIVLAGTLRNEIIREERKVPRSSGYAPERRKLINWLLEKARETGNPLPYDKALEHAKLYRELLPTDIEGPRLMLRVLRARGDLAGEFDLLEKLPATGVEGAFRFEGLGIMKARLGLWLDCEADLRQAVALQPGDAREHASLAEFLRLRGRARESLASVRRAEQTINSIQDPADRSRIGRVLVSCYLALGDVARARESLPLAQTAGPQPYLEGCIAYAAGDPAAASTLFRSVGAGGDGAAAQFALAACLAWQGKLQEAHDLLLRLYDQEPLARHRAATGLAWVFLRCAQYESASGWIDRALEADPQDTFAYYLRGRTLRLSGQLDAAAEALSSALRLRDDFVHAVAEMSELQATRALSVGGSGQIDAALAARRYADRAVELAPAPSQELYEFEGLHAFGAADAAAAKEAFTKSRDLTNDDKLKWFGKGALAIVDYSRGLVDEAANALLRMTQDLDKNDPMAKWAVARLHEIEDHAKKETLGDSFDRPTLGELWQREMDPQLEPKITDKRLVFSGRLQRSTRVYAWRAGAIKRGKDFLALGSSVQAGRKQATANSFFGIALEVWRGGNAAQFDFRVRLGIKEGKPHVWVEDGRDNSGDTSFHQDLTVAGFQLDQPQDLELRVVPRGDESSKAFGLVVHWNGALVFARDLRTLSGSSTNELKTVLFVEGDKGAEVDVAFDDYRLERRKEL